MKEELISFSTAILAKEKGFNVKSYKCYYPYKEIFESHNRVFDNSFTWDTIFIEDNSNWCKLGECYYAHTQSILQQWLREVHKMHIEVRWWSDNTYSAQLISDNYDWADSDEYEAWGEESYEDALEIGLEEGLKVIV